MSRFSAVAPRERAIATAEGETSTPSARTPRFDSAAAIRPGPQPTSSVAPEHRASSRWSPGPASADQRGTGSSHTSPSRMCSWAPPSANPGSKNASDAVTRPPTARPPSTPASAAKRVSGQCPATVTTSPGSSTSDSTGAASTRSPAASSAARVSIPVSGVDIGTSATSWASAARRSPRSHQPPSSASPSTASGPSGSLTRVAAAASTAGSACGVSIPICTVAPSSPAASRWACARRSPSPRPRCSTTRKSDETGPQPDRRRGLVEVAAERADERPVRRHVRGPDGQRRRGPDGVEAVEQRRGREGGGLVGGVDGGQAGLDLAGDRRLGQHHEGDRRERTCGGGRHVRGFVAAGGFG